MQLEIYNLVYVVIKLSYLIITPSMSMKKDAASNPCDLLKKTIILRLCSIVEKKLVLIF